MKSCGLMGGDGNAREMDGAWAGAGAVLDSGVLRSQDRDGHDHRPFEQSGDLRHGDPGGTEPERNGGRQLLRRGGRSREAPERRRDRVGKAGPGAPGELGQDDGRCGGRRSKHSRARTGAAPGFIWRLAAIPLSWYNDQEPADRPGTDPYAGPQWSMEQSEKER